MSRIVVLFLLLAGSASFAQRSASGLLEKRGDEEFFYFNYLQSAETYQKALRKDTANALLKIKIAESYRLAKQPEAAKHWYEKGFMSNDSQIEAAHKFNFSEVLISLGFSEEAKKWLLEYQDQVGQDQLVTAKLQGLNNHQILEKNRSLYALKPVDFNSSGMDFSPFPYKKGIVFVSSRHEKGISHLGEEEFLSLYYTEESEDGTYLKPEVLNKESITSYHEGPTVFFDSENRKIVTRNSFFKKSKIRDGSTNTLELAQSDLSASGKWTEPVTLSFASSDYSVAHPAISSDGSTLYFSSNMSGTLGESDLFVSQYQNGSWSTPKNLGAKINSPGQELFPYLYNDSILFFASTGHSGLGGLDLYSCNLRSSDLTVSNLGAPVNSRSDDFGIFLESNGSSGFFSSNRPGGAGEDDIYYFEEIQQFAEIQLYDSLTRDFIRDAKLTLISGDLIVGRTESDLVGSTEFRLSPLREYKLTISHKDYKSSEVELTPSLWPVNQQAQIKIYLTPLQQRISAKLSAPVETRERAALTNIISFSSSPLDIDVVAETTSQPIDTVAVATGDSFSFPLLKVIVVEIVNDLPSIIVVKNDSIYDFNLISASVLENSDLNIKLDIPHGAKRNDYEKIISEQIYSQDYRISRFLLIRSFFFDSGKNWIRNGACAQLDKIIEVMVTYPQIDVQLIFHSDSRGKEAFNLELSKRRSEEVTTYLTRAGIEMERILSRFVGESQLLNDCGDLADCDELLHQINRTTEFKLIVRKDNHR